MNAQQKRAYHSRLRISDLITSGAYGPWSVLDENLTTTVPSQLRTGPTYFAQAEARINAMLGAYGIPQLFLTVTFSERWPCLLQHSPNHRQRRYYSEQSAVGSRSVLS